MTKIKFLPWVGKDYAKAYYGKRILVLGESHYCPKSEERPTLTQKVIAELSNPDVEFDGYMNTFTKFVRALDGSNIERTEQGLVWQRVMFYNYVQEAMVYARIAPTSEQFRNSIEAFFEVLNTYRPEVVIVWGKRLYNNLPSMGCQGPDVDGVETWTYNLNDGTAVRLLPIIHPSAAFSPPEWHKVITDFLKL